MTADERQRRFVKYVLTLNKSQLSEVQLTRMNSAANFRKTLMQLIEDFIEARAQDLAMGILRETAPERMPREILPARADVPERKRRTPPWVREQSKRLAAKL